MGCSGGDSITDQKILKGLSWFVLGFSALVYLGWAASLTPLAGSFPQLVSMKANTALCFILLAAAGLLRRVPQPNRLRWARRLAVAALAIALLTLVEILFGLNLGIDQLPFPDPASAANPGRMAGSTTVAIVLLSLAQLLDGRLADRHRQLMALIVLILGLSIFLSYPFTLAFGGSLFSYVGMALPSSLVLVALALVLIIEMPDRGWMDILIQRTPIAENTRRLMLAVLVLPFLLGWFIFYGESLGRYEAGLSHSTYAVALMLLLGAVVVYNAIVIQRTQQAHDLLQADFVNVSRQLSSLIENSPSAIFIKDVNGRYQMVNSHFEYLVQKPRASILGRKAEAIFGSTLLPAVLESDRRVMESHQSVNVEVPTHIEGEERIYLNTKFPLFDQAENLVGIGGIWTDISEQKQLAQTLHIKNIDLERSNKELEQFAYVASHDLQEPLRMVSSYMQLLESRYRDQLDSDAKEFIDFAVDGAARMQRLIQDLLAFSRVGTRGKDPEVVAAADAVGEALRNLKIRIEENQATVDVAQLPQVFVDRNQLTQVFQNLIGNAVKFKGEHTPVVTIAAHEAGEFFEFSVADNGIGFDQKHADRIFTIFQRLNSREQYEGTGIGLSICKKIVERHGGRIWVEAAPGQGATFRFTLPRPPRGPQQAGPAGEAGAGQPAAAEPRLTDTLNERAGRMI